MLLFNKSLFFGKQNHSSDINLFFLFAKDLLQCIVKPLQSKLLLLIMQLFQCCNCGITWNYKNAIRGITHLQIWHYNIVPEIYFIIANEICKNLFWFLTVILLLLEASTRLLKHIWTYVTDLLFVNSLFSAVKLCLHVYNPPTYCESWTWVTMTCGI